MLNKNISIWRGTQTPPTNYHLWEKEDGGLYIYLDEKWQHLVTPTDKITLDEHQKLLDKIKNLTLTEINPTDNNTYKSYLLKSDDNIFGTTINIPKDRFIKLVTLGYDNATIDESTGIITIGTGLSKEYLLFSVALLSGNYELVSINLTNFLTEKDYSDGLEVIDNKIKVKIDSDSEEYLKVSNNGIKIEGINTKVSDTVKDIKTKILNGEWLSLRAGRDTDNNIKLGAIAEGTGTTASGENSHAEGHFTTASGKNSHASGNSTNALGENSHAEGSNTHAKGVLSHTEGLSTKAVGNCSHAQGALNYDDSSFIDMIGIGGNTSNSVIEKNAAVIYVGRDTTGLIDVNAAKNGYQYLIDVGGYQGQEIGDAKSVQEVFADINNVLYTLHARVTLTASPTIIEKGVSTAINLSWLYIYNDKVIIPTSMELKSNNNVLENIKHTYTDTINNTKTYLVTAINEGVTNTSNIITVNAYYPMYFGEGNNIFNQIEVITIDNKRPIASSPRGDVSITFTGGKYLWLCIPSTMNITKVTSNGFTVPMEAPITLTIHESYKCYRSTNTINKGTVNFTIDDFIIKGNTIKTSEIDFTTDTLQKFNNSISSGDHVIKTQYSVVDTTHDNIVGQMLLIGDFLGHMVTEILTTSAELKDGIIDWNAHSDTEVNTYIRRNHVKEGGTSSIAVGSWSKWTYYSGEGQYNDFKILVAGELSKKVNTSDVVQQTGDSTTSVMSQKTVTDAILAEIDRATTAENAILYDVSAHNNGAVFKSLSALLGDTNLSTLIPTSVRHGGMSIRFVQSSDNKYVQYRLMANTFSTTVTDWQGVDNEPTIGSNNLVKSGGVADSINKLKNAGYLYAGIATPTTNPGTPDGPVFYIAGEGTYPNFSNITIDTGQLGVLKWDSTWSKQVLEIGLGGSNIILPWTTDIANTRKQVKEANREVGMQITYKKGNDDKWINEQYVGTSLTNSEWIKDSNWQRLIDKTELDVNIDRVSSETNIFISGGSIVKNVTDGDVGDGYYAAGSNSPQGGANYKHSFVSVSGFDSLNINSGEVSVIINFCDSNKQFISNVTTWKIYNNTVQKPENAEYICVSCNTALFSNTIAIECNATGAVPTLKTFINNIKNKIEGGEISTSDVELQKGGYYDKFGDWKVNSGHSTAFIPAIKAKSFSLLIDSNESYIINFVDGEKTFISNVTNWGNGKIESVSCPENVGYICVSSKNSEISKVIDGIVIAYDGVYPYIDKVAEGINRYEENFLRTEIYTQTFSSKGGVNLEQSLLRIAKAGDTIEYKVELSEPNDTIELVLQGDWNKTIFNSTKDEDVWYSFVLEANFSKLHLYFGQVTNPITATVTLRHKITLDTAVAKYDVVDNLNSDNPQLVLSAAQGKVLSEMMYKQDAAYAFSRSHNMPFHKGFFLDAGRKYFSPDNIKKMLDYCASAGLNFFQIYFCDHMGFRFALDDMLIDRPDGGTFDLSVCLGDNPNNPGDNSNQWLTQSEMVDIIEYAYSKNIEVIPAFDMPGHLNAIEDRLPLNLKGVRTELAVQFKLNIIDKYVKFFKSQGSRFYNICGDEIPMDINVYANFINKACRQILQNDMVPMIFNDMICKDNKYLEPYINNGLIVMSWTRKDSEPPQSFLDRCGYRQINCDINKYYWTLQDGAYDRIPTMVSTLNSADISVMAGGETLPNIVGAYFCVWCDGASHDGADGGDAVANAIQPLIEAFGDACNRFLEV